jgi:hypothetical protein
MRGAARIRAALFRFRFSTSSFCSDATMLLWSRIFMCSRNDGVRSRILSHHMTLEEDDMKKYLLAAAMTCAIATPVLADDVGVRVGPVGAGVTVGESHEYRDRDRDRTVIREHEPRDKTTVIKKDENGVRSKTVIHDRD